MELHHLQTKSRTQNSFDSQLHSGPDLIDLDCIRFSFHFALGLSTTLMKKLHVTYNLTSTHS